MVLQDRSNVALANELARYYSCQFVVKDLEDNPGVEYDLIVGPWPAHSLYPKNKRPGSAQVRAAAFGLIKLSHSKLRGTIRS